MEVPLDQGLHDHALHTSDKIEVEGRIRTPARLMGRALWYAAGLLAGAILIGFFVWVWVGAPALHLP